MGVCVVTKKWCLVRLVGAVLLAGCAAQPAADAAGGSALVLTVDRSQYRSGQPIVLTLRNEQSHGIGYNLCGAGLERRVGDEWREVEQRLAEVCTLELRTLGPGGSESYQHTVPGGLPGGEYRVRTIVESPLGGNSAGVASAPFTITS